MSGLAFSIEKSLVELDYMPGFVIGAVSLLNEARILNAEPSAQDSESSPLAFGLLFCFRQNNCVGFSQVFEFNGSS